MKIFQKNMPKFLEDPPNFQSILFHGHDLSVIDDYVFLLKKKFQEKTSPLYDIKEINETHLKDQPNILIQETHSPSFFHDARLIIVSNASDQWLEGLKKALKSDTKDHRFIFRSNQQLPASSKLRKFIEKETNSYCVGCYEDNPETIKSLIQNLLTKDKKTIDFQALLYLTQHLSSHRQILRTEMEKLILFTSNKSHITLEDISICLPCPDHEICHPLIMSMICGNMNEITQSLEKIIFKPQNHMILIRGTISHFKKLHAMAQQIQRGQSIQETIKKQSPPIFFKNIPYFEKQLKIWTPPHIEKALMQCLNCEKQMKTLAISPELILGHTMVQITLKAQKINNRPLQPNYY